MHTRLSGLLRFGLLRFSGLVSFLPYVCCVLPIVLLFWSAFFQATAPDQVPATAGIIDERFTLARQTSAVSDRVSVCLPRPFHTAFHAHACSLACSCTLATVASMHLRFLCFSCCHRVCSVLQGIIYTLLRFSSLVYSAKERVAKFKTTGQGPRGISQLLSLFDSWRLGSFFCCGNRRLSWK